jgi:hypothetical protein
VSEYFGYECEKAKHRIAALESELAECRAELEVAIEERDGANEIIHRAMSEAHEAITRLTALASAADGLRDALENLCGGFACQTKYCISDKDCGECVMCIAREALTAYEQARKEG